MLIGILGFMPLTVIHIADRRPQVRLSLPRQAALRLSIIKTSLLVVLTDWALTLTVF